MLENNKKQIKQKKKKKNAKVKEIDACIRVQITGQFFGLLLSKLGSKGIKILCVTVDHRLFCFHMTTNNILLSTVVIII